MLCEKLIMLKKPKFRTQFERIAVITNNGERFEKERIGKINRITRCVEAVETGNTIDRYELIQAHANECDINYLIAKFKNGDTTALSKRQGAYLDLTAFPTDFRELNNTIENGERLFNDLPVDIRKKFNNDFKKFVELIGSDEWYENLKIEKKGKEPMPEPSSESTLEPKPNDK